MENQKKEPDNTPTPEDELFEALLSSKDKRLPISTELMREHILLPNRFKRKQDSLQEDEEE